MFGVLSISAARRSSRSARLSAQTRRRRRVGVASVAVLVAGLISTVPAVPAQAAAPAVTQKASAPTDLGPVPTDRTTRPWSTGAVTDPPAVQKTPAIAGITDGGEVPGLRSRMSNTYVKGSMLQTVVSTLPVNFQSGNSWLPIDDSLVADAKGLLSLKADDFQVALPALSGLPAVTGFGGAVVTSTLLGAAPVLPAVKGATATYSKVFPGVDEIFQIRPRVLEQTFRLADASAPTSYAQSVSLTPGYTLAKPDGNGSINIVAGDGSVVGSLPAPVLMDSGTNPDTNISTVNAHYEITGPAPLYTVTTVVDREWLASRDRVFPVLLDPSTTFGTSIDNGCYVSSPGAPDPSLCAGNSGVDADPILTP